MVNLKAAIDALKTVSIVCGMIPVVGDNLKSAVELASTICEQVQVRRTSVSYVNNSSQRFGRLSDQTIKENSEGYEQLGVQVADLITAVASVLQQSKQDAALERAMQANVGGLLEYALLSFDVCSVLIPSNQGARGDQGGRREPTSF
jgi:hypothetical protein